MTFITDIRMADIIDMGHRTKRKAIEYIVDRYHKKGNRGTGLALPPQQRQAERRRVTATATKAVRGKATAVVRDGG